MYSAIIRKLRPLLGSRLNMLGTVAALTLILILAGAALAAHPKAGSKYAGFTSAPKVNGFRAPVSFKVSSSGSKLLSFKYGNTGCPSQTTPAGNPYLKSGSLTTVGTIQVASAGTFSVKNLKTSTGPATYTISSVTGKFKSAKTATGSIKISNWFSVPGNTHSCGSASVTFTATTK
jgi:hypothetical protein